MDKPNETVLAAIREAANKPHSDEFLEHAIQAKSQYDSTCRRLAAEILANRGLIEGLRIEIATRKRINDKSMARSYGFISGKPESANVAMDDYSNDPELHQEFMDGRQYYLDLTSGKVT